MTDLARDVAARLRTPWLETEALDGCLLPQAASLLLALAERVETLERERNNTLFEILNG